ELIRNDVPWEGAVVEGPFVLRRREWFYLFYSGSGCCGRGCAYALGVARSHALHGPWEKNPANPILSGNEHWKCPGHGSIVTDERGRYFLLYHAYDARTFVYTGREMGLPPTSERASELLGAVVARPTTSGDYEATTVVDTRGLKLGAFAGLFAFGDPANALGAAVGEGKAVVWRRENNQPRAVAE